MTRCYLLLKALLFALELLFPVAILAVLHDIRACTTRAFIDNHFSDHAPLYHQLALNYYQLVDGALQVHKNIHLEQPGLLEVLFTTPTLPVEDTENARYLVQQRIVSWLAERSNVPEERRVPIARMCIHITDSFYALMVARTLLEPAIVGEAREVLLAYLTPLLGNLKK
jgi:hypothetical protein